MTTLKDSPGKVQGAISVPQGNEDPEDIAPQSIPKTRSEARRRGKLGDYAHLFDLDQDYNDLSADINEVKEVVAGINVIDPLTFVVDSKATGANSMAAFGGVATGTASLAIGAVKYSTDGEVFLSEASGDGSMALYGSEASGVESMALYGSEASGVESMALYRSSASGDGSVALYRSSASGDGSVAIGGENDLPAVASGERSVAIGAGSNAINDYDISIGFTSDTEIAPVEIGGRNVSIGANAVVARGLNSCVAIGYGTHVKQEDVVDGDAVMSVGHRRIVRVNAPINDNDAVTLGYLKSQQFNDLITVTSIALSPESTSGTLPTTYPTSTDTSGYRHVFSRPPATFKLKTAANTVTLTVVCASNEDAISLYQSYYHDSPQVLSSSTGAIASQSPTVTLTLSSKTVTVAFSGTFTASNNYVIF